MTLKRIKQVKKMDEGAILHEHEHGTAVNDAHRSFKSGVCAEVEQRVSLRG